MMPTNMKIYAEQYKKLLNITNDLQYKILISQKLSIVNSITFP